MERKIAVRARICQFAVKAFLILFALGLPLDHYVGQLAAVNAVTVDAVNKAAQRAIVKEDFVVVLVGDRTAIESGLKDKNLGELMVLNKDGTPTK